jgi:putative protein kinase ArgK-like GTPase of G3E family
MELSQRQKRLHSRLCVRRHVGGVNTALQISEEHVIIETVGVGQSETAVHSMVDFFCY